METDFWRFASSVNPSRVESLLAASSFDEISAAIEREIPRSGSVEYFHEDGKEMVDCWRPRFLLSVDSVIGDRFFNSSCGYRAQYVRSFEAGNEANRRLLSQLHDLLVRHAKKQQVTEIPSLEKALRDSSTKAWVFQRGGQLNLSPTATEPEILVPSWIANWEIAKVAGENLNKSRDERPRETPAIWGVRLHGPTINRLVIYGAWIDSNGQVQSPLRHKRDRSLYINEFGFA